MWVTSSNTSYAKDRLISESFQKFPISFGNFTWSIKEHEGTDAVFDKKRQHKFRRREHRRNTSKMVKTYKK